MERRLHSHMAVTQLYGGYETPCQLQNLRALISSDTSTDHTHIHAQRDNRKGVYDRLLATHTAQGTGHTTGRWAISVPGEVQ